MERHIAEWRLNGLRHSPSVTCRSVSPLDAGWELAVQYATDHFATAVLAAGDMEPPLRDITEFKLALEGERIVGIAGRFLGFEYPSLTVSADTREAADVLLRAFAPSNGLLAVAHDQPLPSWAEHLSWSVDPWLSSDCGISAEAAMQTERISDARELAEFYERMNVRYWCPEMLPAGAFVVREQSGAIVAAVAVLFVLPVLEYAHLGALVTAPEWRGRGLARALTAAARSELARRGMARCGLFADAARPWLGAFYERVGFAHVGAFRFAALP